MQKCEKRVAELARKLKHAREMTEHFEAKIERMTAEGESAMLELHFDNESKRDKHLKAIDKAIDKAWSRPICDVMPARLSQELRDNVYHSPTRTDV